MLLPQTRQIEIPTRTRTYRRSRFPIDPQERCDDIQSCTGINQVFEGGQHQEDVGEQEVLSSFDKAESGLDPYDDLVPGSSSRAERRRQYKGAGQISRTGSEASYLTANSAHNGSRRTLGASSGACVTARRRHHSAGTMVAVEREIHIALVHRRSRSRERRGRLARGSSSRSDDMTPPSLVTADDGESQRSNSTLGDFDIEDDDFDCCLQLWEILVKLFLLLIRLANFVLDHKILLYPLAFFFGYLFLGMLHSIMASLMATATGWIWPPTHFFLSTTAGFIWRMADWLMWIDELGRSLVCDMAASYCRKYRLLCDRQCSFVDRAMEHGVYGRRCF